LNPFHRSFVTHSSEEEEGEEEGEEEEGLLQEEDYCSVPAH
jgi:hypothetical protein